ncbi:MAG: RNA methyltransferase [bacterium]
MSKLPLFVLVENVRSLYNVGAIFRTADGAGVSKIFLTGLTGRPPHREIRKVALGAEETIEWQYFDNSVDLVDQLKSQNVQIVVLESTPSSLPYDKVPYRFPLCLVVGHEYHGVSSELIRKADQLIQIPMHGAKVSLNVSVAFGIAVYEIVRARSSTQGHN